MAAVRLRNLKKMFGESLVVDDVSLDVADGEFLVLVGPSGCGKSTILRMIAGLENVTNGEILIADHVVNDMSPRERDIAMVFQDYALYPHLSVYKNMSFGLEVRKTPRAQIRERVAAAAEKMNITSLLDRKPRQLSGGQRQRVAIGRAIVRRPSAYLFDEPLSNLDARLRSQMRTEIKKLHQTVESTIIYVTHDQVEAMTLADRIVVMQNGVVEQVGTPDEIYNQPGSIFVAEFTGSPAMNMLPCRIVSAGEGLAAELETNTIVPLPSELQGRCRELDGSDAVLGVRPEKFAAVFENTNPSSGCTLSATIDVIEPLGSNTLFFFRIASTDVIARLPPDSNYDPGDRLELYVDSEDVYIFDATTGRRI